MDVRSLSSSTADEVFNHLYPNQPELVIIERMSETVGSFWSQCQDKESLCHLVLVMHLSVS